MLYVVGSDNQATVIVDGGKIVHDVHPQHNRIHLDLYDCAITHNGMCSLCYDDLSCSILKDRRIGDDYIFICRLTKNGRLDTSMYALYIYTTDVARLSELTSIALTEQYSLIAEK